MNRILRIGLAAIFLIAILVLAQRQMVVAGSLPASIFGGVLRSPAASGAAAPNLDPGTVKPPPAATTGGGVCIFRVIQPLESGFSLAQNLMPFNSLGNKPDEIVSYLAGVCRAIYSQTGVGVIDDLGSHGQVQICFASVPNTNGVIYIYNPYQTETGPASGETYTALTTTPDGSLLCAPAQQTGKYFLANVKQ
jgi:hypothetical protein